MAGTSAAASWRIGAGQAAFERVFAADSAGRCETLNRGGPLFETNIPG